MIKIGILGVAGRMGRSLVEQTLQTPGCILAGGIERKSSPYIGEDMARLAGLDPCGVDVTDDLDLLLDESDVVIDFTAPALTVQCAEQAARQKTAIVTGTTGLSEEDRDRLREYSHQTPILQSANMSVGVNLLLNLVEQAAATLEEDIDIEILEMHHRNKVDSPSGTAIALGNAAAQGRGVRLKDVERRERSGIIGARPQGEIGFATLRGGDVIGDHSVIFAADGERVELTHKASNRSIYAKGALRAALWLHGKPPALYHMRDVLRENTTK